MDTPPARREPDAEVVVSVADDHLADVAGVADRLRAAGMTVGRALPTVGVVTGSVPAARLDELARVEGVAAVERARTFRIPPPEADIQ